MTTLIQAAHNDEFGVLIALAVTTGLRESEVLGLAWSDIDLNRGVLTVRNTLHSYAAERFELEPPKSRTSRRKVPIASVIVRMLEAHKAKQEETRALVGKAYSTR